MVQWLCSVSRFIDSNNPEKMLSLWYVILRPFAVEPFTTRFHVVDIFMCTKELCLLVRTPCEPHFLSGNGWHCTRESKHWGFGV